VKQDDGVVIIEAPISSGYSAQVIAEVERRFPGAKIKAAISTSDAWPHLGGIREYVARGIPLYILDINQPIINRILNAAFKTHSDRLAKNPIKADLRIVSSKTVIGNGNNCLELYPIRTESGERMLMVYLPETKLLYGADLVQPQADGTFFMPQYLSELQAAVKREGLVVERVFAIHAPVIEWSKIVNAITAY
jgi:hypothetical protein